MQVKLLIEIYQGESVHDAMQAVLQDLARPCNKAQVILQVPV